MLTTMEFKILHVLLWLITAFVLTTQEMVRLSVSPVVTAKCGQPVTLDCNASSSRDGLVITHVAWVQNNRSLCGLDGAGKVTMHHRNTLSDFKCGYSESRLSLIFQQVRPMESVESVYVCKLRSNQGSVQAYTRVELQECCGHVSVAVTPEGPVCTFSGVHPDGDVHWFHGSTRLSGGSLRTNTTKHVEAGGWLTVSSSLEKKDYQKPYNCSLWNPKSGRYIASRLVPVPGGDTRTDPARSGAGAQGPLWTFLCFLFTTAFLLKL